nr:unnamed protein product [Digitaria exilis]
MTASSAPLQCDICLLFSHILARRRRLRASIGRCPSPSSRRGPEPSPVLPLRHAQVAHLVIPSSPRCSPLRLGTHSRRTPAHLSSGADRRPVAEPVCLCIRAELARLGIRAGRRPATGPGWLGGQVKGPARLSI